MRPIPSEFVIASADDIAAIELFHAKFQFAMARSLVPILLGIHYPATTHHASDDLARRPTQL